MPAGTASHDEPEVLALTHDPDRQLAIAVGLDRAPTKGERLGLQVGREAARPAEDDLARAELLGRARDREERIVRRDDERYDAPPVSLGEVDDGGEDRLLVGCE